MTNQTEAVVSFPTLQEAEALMPAGRKAYAHVRRVLINENKTMAYKAGDGFNLARAISEVAEASRNESLEPPLPDPIKDAVYVADSYVNKESYTGARSDFISPNFNPVAAKLILQAVFEHGYRSEGV